MKIAEIKRKPEWVLKKIDFKQMTPTAKALEGLNLRTVCHQARCPNISECFGRKTATFLILGDKCTRACAFCNVTKAKPTTLDTTEPDRLLEAVKRLNLNYVVITSVTRDDLADGGAEVFVQIINKIKKYDKQIKVEVLVPDFKGKVSAIAAVTAAGPHIFAHNLETVKTLYAIRKGANYERSLAVLKAAKKAGAKLTKSGIMLGLGETKNQVKKVFADLRKVNCDYLSIGQYLRPTENNQPVVEYLKPEAFEEYKVLALETGFTHVESGVFVRSSYHAEDYK